MSTKVAESPIQPVVLSIVQAGVYLSVSPDTVRRLIRGGRFPTPGSATAFAFAGPIWTTTCRRRRRSSGVRSTTVAAGSRRIRRGVKMT